MYQKITNCSDCLVRQIVFPLQSKTIYQVVEMKKEHPCHKSTQWKVIRMGADIRIKCLGCGASVLMPRVKFEKKLKKVISKGE